MGACAGLGIILYVCWHWPGSRSVSVAACAGVTGGNLICRWGPMAVGPSLGAGMLRLGQVV